MYRDERYKIVVYHGHEQGELYDLQEDPGEFKNLWDDSDCGRSAFRSDAPQLRCSGILCGPRTAPDEAVLIYAQTDSCIGHDENLAIEHTHLSQFQIT